MYLEKTMKIIAGLFSLIGLMGLLAIILAYPTKWLWNYTMPYMFNFREIDAQHALGLLFLASILFSSKNTSEKKST